jgi:glycosyltransferase involved in cell wall biosynthesis
MPLTVLEAMACGVPTVASSVGGTPELIADGVNGFLIETKNIGQLRDDLLRLVNDEKLRRSIGRQGRAYAEKHHNWGKVAIEMDGVYRHVSQESA